MNSLNIDDFCKDVAKTLVILYKQFPQRVTLYVEDISGPDQPDEFGLHSPRFSATFHTLLWLADTDYLRFSQTVKQEALEEVTLTHRAFMLLSSSQRAQASEPRAGELLSPRIEQLHLCLQNQSSDTLKALVLHFMEQSRDYR